MTDTAAKPNASSRVEVDASPAEVYALISDIDSMVKLGKETASVRWLDGATEARVDAKFQGNNRNGARNWSTVATVTDAEPGVRFAFNVRSKGLPIARWQYDIAPTAGGCAVTESTWDQRLPGISFIGALISGVWRRNAVNQRNIELTLQRLKTKAESPA